MDMKTPSKVAHFIENRIEEAGLMQTDIAKKVGFDKPNMITMIKQGRTRLPIDKVCLMANALEADPIQLLKLCLEEYQPNNWKVIAPLVDSALTKEEVQLLSALRTWIGGPFLAALSDESKEHFNKFLASLRVRAPIQ